jgi:hypothetical protein
MALTKITMLRVLFLLLLLTTHSIYAEIIAGRVVKVYDRLSPTASGSFFG